MEVLDTSGSSDEWMGFQRTDSSDAVVLVYSTCKRSTFRLMRKTFDTTELPSPVMLVGTMKDRPDARQVTEEEGRELANQLGAPFFETSAKDGTGVEQAFASLLETMSDSRRPAPIRAKLVPVPPAFDHMAYHTQEVPNAVSHHPTHQRSTDEHNGQNRKVFGNEINGLRSGFDEPEIPRLLSFWRSMTSWICGVGRTW